MTGLLPLLLVGGGLAFAQQSANPLVASGSIERNVAPGSTVTQLKQPVPDMPPMPVGKATVFGGTIHTIDQVRDRMTLQVFGGGRTGILFDERTRVFRDGRLVSPGDLKAGERAYVDTVLDGTAIFAKNIRVGKSGPTGQSSGQVVAFDPRSGELTLRDTISPNPVKMQLAQNASIRHGERATTAAELRAGALVNLSFSPSPNGPAQVHEVSIIAAPGAEFVFFGRVEHLDLRRGLLVVLDPRDDKSYDVAVNAEDRRLIRDLREGQSVTVNATFNGQTYQARNVTITPTAPAQK